MVRYFVNTGLFLCLLVLASGISFGTETPVREPAKYTISGTVKDKQTGEVLIGATILVKEAPATGAVTNSYGFFSLAVAEGNYTVTASYVGYATGTEKVTLRQNVKVNFVLEEQSEEQKAVVITGERSDDNVSTPQMGLDKISVKEIEKVPIIFGEKDVMKTIQLLPGIKPAGEGSSGFYVRGGATDQNLILLDEATVYSASHLMGFFSVFNSDAINDVMVYKGTMPAEYGGRLSSVVDIKMKEGNNQKFALDAGLGLIASRLTVEGPIIPDKMSFAVSARRTYADLFLKLSSDTTINKTKLYFYDLNAKLNYQLGENDKLYLSGYFGGDVLGLGDIANIDWGNSTATLRWNHLFSTKLFSNTSLIYSIYDYTIGSNFAGNQLTAYSQIKDYNFKEDLHYYIDDQNEMKSGWNSVYHVIVPGTITATNTSSTATLTLRHQYSWENAFYLSHVFKPNPVMNFEYGLRLSMFSVVGPGVYNSYNAQGVVLDTLTYSSGTIVKTYVNLEPRFTVNYMLDTESSLKASYNRNTQNLHLLSNSTSESPTDMWIPNSNNVQPEIADQFSLGYFRNFEDNQYEFSLETYYKILQHQIDYKTGAQLLFNQNVESQLLFGSGRAYGVELFLKKKYGRLTGWISYTLSRVEMKFDAINNGNYYPARQDRTHDISIVGIYQLSERWSLSATWVYYTGNAVTFPSGKYMVNDKVYYYYTERNGYRMPAYHRLDIGFTWQGEKSSWSFSLYNAYGRENAYVIRFQTDPNDASRTQAVQTSLFRFVPSVTYNFKF